MMLSEICQKVKTIGGMLFKAIRAQVAPPHGYWQASVMDIGKPPFQEPFGTWKRIWKSTIL
jgi:hypothetical protein